MMAQKNTDANASECQKCHNTHATMTAETIETRVTAYFTLEGGLVHQFALDIGISLLRRYNGIAGDRQAEQKNYPQKRQLDERQEFWLDVRTLSATLHAGIPA
jgi:hypothetical protein